MVTNNQFGMGTSLERHTAQTDLHKRGEGYGVPGLRCDGMDVVDTYEVMSEAIEQVRAERTPILVEAITYRFRGHSMADPEEYRTKEQVEEWRKRDPIPRYAERLELAEDDIEGARRGGGRARSTRPSTFAEASDFPSPESLYDHVYVLPGELSRAALPRGAQRSALREELERDERVLLMGEDIGVFNGAFKVTQGLLEEFGEKRVRDTPISENTIVGVGVGAAMAGLRPIVELMTINFSLLAMDQIVNHMSTIHYMFGGQVTVPMVVRMPQGAGHQLGPTHSHCLEAIYLHVPGLLVAVPSTPADAKGLLKAAIRDDNPVVFIEHESLYGVKGEVPDDDDTSSTFGQAAIRREGDDVTIVGISRMALTAQAGGRDARGRARDRGRGDRPAHAAPARPRHDPRVGPQDQPLRDRRGGLAARRRRRQPRGADPGAGVRPPRRADRARDRRRPADALLEAARADRVPARAAGRRDAVLALFWACNCAGSQGVLQPRAGRRVEAVVPLTPGVPTCGHA